MKLLAKIQQTLNAPKNQTNKFGGFNYRNCEDILQAVKPLLEDSVILVSDEIVQVGDRIYVKATAKYIHGDVNINISAYAREALSRKGMDDAMCTGASSSYARKYALNGLLLIDDNKDPDFSHGSDIKQKSVKRSKPSELASLMVDGNDFNTCEYWRGMNQQDQESEWLTLDKESQKKLKTILSETMVKK